MSGPREWEKRKVMEPNAKTMTTSEVTRFEPVAASSLIRDGEGCPGAVTRGNREHAYWFREFEENRAIGLTPDFSEMPERDAKAMATIHQEVGFVEQADRYERMRRG